MELSLLLRKLAAVRQDLPSIATVTLDVAGARPLPAPARLFVKSNVLAYLNAEGRPPALRETLKKTAREIREYAENELGPETQGLFIAAGPGLFESVELLAPMRNFVHVGRAPYLAPLLEGAARVPRSVVVEAGLRGIQIDELDSMGRRPLHRIEPRDVVRDVQRASSGRRIAGRGGSGAGGSARDRYQQGADAAVAQRLHEAARVVASLLPRAPGAEIFFFGSNELSSHFLERLPGRLRKAFHHAGPAVHDASTTRDVVRSLVELHEERVRGEVVEYLDRRNQGKLVAWGPRDVMGDLAQGTVRRIFLDADDPVPGMSCRDCGTRHPGAKRTCDYCSGEVAPVSLTQEVVAHALQHPPIDLTFVPKPAPWLVQVGGLTALTSEHGVRTRR